jgi:very-short-patch-repair endonuclease
MKYKPLIVAAYYKSMGLLDPVFEYAFHPTRKWRFDMCWPAAKVAVEVDGGIWISGGHTRGAQIKNDWEKRNAATSLGWRILYCEPRDLCTQELALLIIKTMEANA